MGPLHIIFITGTAIFGAGFVLTLICCIAFAARTISTRNSFSDGHAYRIHWNRTVWIYAALLANFFLLMQIYLSQFYGQGIFTLPTLARVFWSRWLMLALIGFINAYTLTCVMTHSKKRDPQSIAFILAYVLTYLWLFIATWSMKTQTRGWWFAGSIFLFLLTIVLYLVPANKWRVHDSRYHPELQNAPWYAYYHRAFLFLVFIVPYVAYFFIWLLSGANGLTDAMSAEAEVASYLCFDALPLILFMVYIVATTGRHLVHLATIEDTQTGEKTLAKNVSQQQQSKALKKSRQAAGGHLL